jgi:hypothetical protein
LAITAHADGEVGVCFKNHLDHGAHPLCAYCSSLGCGELTTSLLAWGRCSST